MKELKLLEGGKLPIKHQLAKLVIGSIAGFAATHFSEKVYDIAYEAYRHRKLKK